jgi:hypothetical protein
VVVVDDREALGIERDGALGTEREAEEAARAVVEVDDGAGHAPSFRRSQREGGTGQHGGRGHPGGQSRDHEALWSGGPRDGDAADGEADGRGGVEGAARGGEIAVHEIAAEMDLGELDRDRPSERVPARELRRLDREGRRRRAEEVVTEQL